MFFKKQIIVTWQLINVFLYEERKEGKKYNTSQNPFLRTGLFVVVGVGISLGISLVLVASKMTAGALHEDASKALYMISGPFYEVH